MSCVFYCHGLPGSAAEVTQLLSPAGNSLQVLAPLDVAAFDAAMSNHKSSSAHIIGFSLGAMTALKIAANRPEAVSQITLIAPAAPLELGDFLPRMAGRPVFNMAAKGRLAFRIFTAFQRFGVAMVPEKIVNVMFAGSLDADMALLSDTIFTSALRDGLKASFGKNRDAYLHAVSTYVQPWADDLKRVKCPVTLHHGTADNWAPFEMTKVLADNIPTSTEITPHEGLGHYSTLQRALPLIFEQI